MEPPKQLFGSRILVATTENYRELISSRGNTLVIYSSWAGIYACDRRIRQAFWRIEEDYPRKQLNLVLVDISQCRTDPDTIDTIPRFRLFRDGKELLPLQSRHNNGELLRAWLTEGIGPAPMKEAPIDWYRSIILFRRGERAFFVYGFAKNEQANIDASDERDFKELAKVLLAASVDDLKKLVEQGEFVEVMCHEQG